MGEAHAGRLDLVDAIDPEGSPGLAVTVEGHQVPAAGGMDQLERLDVAF
jgi:hypothetical protein